MNSEVLLIAIVQPEDLSAATVGLKRAGLRVTQVSTQGGFLRRPNCTLLLGMPRAEVARATRIFAATCRTRTGYVNSMPDLAGAGGGAAWMSMPLEVEIGGATLFVCTIVQHVHLPASEPATDGSASPQDAGLEPDAAPSLARPGGAMKLVLATVAEQVADDLVTALTRERYHVTLISTTGGFLRKGNATLLIGVPPEQVSALLNKIQDRVRAAQAPIGGVAFVLDTENHLRL